MKIGLVCPYNLFKGGGVQECVFAMQAELSKRGHEVLIISPQPREHTGNVPEFVRLLGRAADVKSPFHTTAQISASVDMDQVDQLLEHENFDVLHFHEPWVPLLSYQLLTRSRAKNIATFHAKLPDTVMSRTIERVVTPYTKSLLKYFSAYSAVSEAAAGYVRTLTTDEIEIVPNGIDIAKYRSHKYRPAEKPFVFYIGRLEKRKGVKFLIKAMALLQQTYPDVGLVIAGDGPDRPTLERYAADLGVSAEFVGRIADAEKLAYLSKARVFCSPARYGESFGIVLLEAMAAGVPVIAGDNPGYSAVMQGSGSLSLVDPSQAEDFARRLALLTFDDAYRAVWQDWAAQAVERYNYPLVVDQYEHIYKNA